MGIGILGNLGILGILEELGSIIGDMIFVPNGANGENSLSGDGLGILGNLEELGELWL